MTAKTQEAPRAGRDGRATADRIRTATGSTFIALVLEAPGPIAVEFMSYGCEHCRALEPILQYVADVVKARGRILRVNVAEDVDLARTYGITATPTLVMFLDGNEVGRVEGPDPSTSSVLTAVTFPFRRKK